MKTKIKKTTLDSIFYILLLVLGIISLLMTGCSSDKPVGENKSVIVFGAASTTNAVTDIAAMFTAQTHIDVITNFASSSTLAQQIESGADVDVYISANQKWADYLEGKQFCRTRETILGNRIVIIVPNHSSLPVDSAEILLSPDIKHIAMGDPSCVPAGKYGKEALEKLKLWSQIESKVSAAKDVRSALAYVETQAAEAGIVYSTDSAISDKVKVVYLFPADATAKPISYPAMAIKNAVNPENAQLFFDYLQSDAAKEIFKKYGFITD